MVRIATLSLFVMFVAGCPKPTEPGTPPPNPPPDSDWCDNMCHWIGPEGLNCEEGRKVYNSDLPGPEGVPNQECADWCRELQDPSHMYFVNPRCVSETPSCDKIEEYREKDHTVCEGKPLPKEE